ncbi:MAG: hypothetical protein H6713_38265 [Myxococcales bacterium]|nr:hypothetical protein [Myxococcales bacterium]
MGHRITYAIRERGEVTLYSSRWGALTSPQDVFWGPDETRAFIEGNAPADSWYDDCWGEGGVALDLDTKTVAFYGVYTYGPALRELYVALMRELWGPAWSIRWVDDMPEIAAQVGVDPDLVRSPPFVGDLERLGAALDRGLARGLITVLAGGAARELVVDIDVVELLMNGPRLLEHLERGMPWDVFLARDPAALGDDRRPLRARLRRCLALDPAARRVVVHCADARHDLGFLGRVLAPRWPGWRVELRPGDAAEHFAALGRALPAALAPGADDVVERDDRDEDEPADFHGRVEAIAELLFGSEQTKDETAAFAARVGQDVRADAGDGPVRFAPDFFDRIPSAGPDAGAGALFRRAVAAVAARGSS